MEKYKTVGELRKLLATFPADFPVAVCDVNTFEPVCAGLVNTVPYGDAYQVNPGTEPTCMVLVLSNEFEAKS